ncbi:MAG TPA: PKD domain-containing protein, partial [Thermoanaerobaculia bacterium]
MQTQRAFGIHLVVMLVILGALVFAGDAMAAHGCVPTPNRQCLAGGRFAVATAFNAANPKPGKVISLPGTNAVAFGILDAKNPEFVVKIVDGRKINGHFWVFYAGLTRARVKLTVTDTLTGASKSYVSQTGSLASQADTGAFKVDRLAFPGGPPSGATQPTDLFAGFTYSPVDPITGEEITFSDQSLGAPEQWCWNFGDGTGDDCSGPYVVHAYASAGTYTVTLTVSSAEDPIDVSAQGTVTVSDPVCTFDVSLDTASFGAAGGGGTVTLNASSPDCPWFAASQSSFIEFPAQNGSGSATIGFQVDPNDTGAPRSGTLVVADQTLTITEDAQPCSFAIDPPGVILTPPGQTSSVTVDAAAGCAWSVNVASGSSFITLLNPAGGIGPGVLQFEVSANTATSSRSGVLIIAGQTFAVEQLGVSGFGVDFFVTAASAPVGSPISFIGKATEPPASWCWTFGDGSEPPGGCAATEAQATHSYASPGTYSVTLAALADGGSSAEATKTVIIFQGGTSCVGLLYPQSASVSAAGGVDIVNVNAPADCGWTAASDETFLHVVAASVDHGSGVVTYQVDVNTTGAARTGTLSIGGRGFTVSQRPPCTYSFAPGSTDPVGRAGGVGTVHVQTQAGCPWTATTSSPFVGLLTATARTGPGDFDYCMAANRGADRTGTITITGESIEIPQSGFDLPPGECQATPTSLCLLGKQFEIRLAFRTSAVPKGVGTSKRLNDSSGYFTFFDPKNPEILVK